MVRRSLFAVFLITFAVLCTAAASQAQEPTESRDAAGAPAHVSFVEGAVTLEREGRLDDAPGNMPLLSGDRLRTRAGRVEILFADGSTLHLDHDTTLDLQSDELVRLIGGRLRLSIPGPSRDISYRIDTATGWAQIDDAGEYRAAFVQNELELAVLRGRAELINEDGRTPLRAGERAFVRPSAAPSHAYVFNSASWDSFDRWSESRRSERLGLSTQYLPQEVRPYSASFDRYGSWRYESSYGYVWYPRVEVDWRPYYRGRWTTLRPYGATWVSVDPWGWPTHHYGRWGFNAGAWFWIPGRTWGPAWVSWAYAPGYVSWCPLGWNNRPVVQINVYGGSYYRGYDPWRAWTVVHHRNFGGGYVHRNVVAGHRIDERTRGAFVHRDRAPDGPSYAVPRGSAAPIRVAGTGAQRRATSPLLTNRDAAAFQSNRPASSLDRTTGPRQAVRASESRGEAAALTTGRERSAPSRPMVRSERGVAPEAARSQDEIRPQGSNRAVARAGDHPAYQPADRGAVRSRAPAPIPSRPEPMAVAPRSQDANRGGDLEMYRRQDRYRARPESSTPTERRAVPRADYGRPPSPERGGDSRQASPARQRAAPSGGGERAAQPAQGSRPSGAAPARSAPARPRGGR